MKLRLLNRSIPHLLFSTFSATVLLASLAQAGMAQTASTADDLQWLNNGSENMDAGSADGLNMYDMMHRMQQGTIRSQSEFLHDQQQTMGTAAEEFRNKQRQALEQQTGTPAPAAPMTVQSVPSSTNQSLNQTYTP